jgi:methylphosphotriester-DNA--protein-cysteine methyltransferase
MPYQHISGALCGMTVGEYIHTRRMTVAAQELAASEAKVIDGAIMYGYDSSDSFIVFNRKIVTIGNHPDIPFFP